MVVDFSEEHCLKLEMEEGVKAAHMIFQGVDLDAPYEVEEEEEEEATDHSETPQERTQPAKKARKKSVSGSAPGSKRTKSSSEAYVQKRKLDNKLAARRSREKRKRELVTAQMSVEEQQKQIGQFSILLASIRALVDEADSSQGKLASAIDGILNSAGDMISSIVSTPTSRTRKSKTKPSRRRSRSSTQVPSPSSYPEYPAIPHEMASSPLSLPEEMPVPAPTSSYSSTASTHSPVFDGGTVTPATKPPGPDLFTSQFPLSVFPSSPLSPSSNFNSAFALGSSRDHASVFPSPQSKDPCAKTCFMEDLMRSRREEEMRKYLLVGMMMHPFATQLQRQDALPLFPSPVPTPGSLAGAYFP